MSLNTAHANGGVLIYNGELILLYCNNVEFTLEGGDAKAFGGSKKGRIYLTTHRMIFINKTEKDPMQSFSFPFFSLSKVELEQPVFGANFIKGRVQAQAQGNWTGNAVFKLKFFSGGAIEFGQAMVKTVQMARQAMPPQPPPYMPQQGPYYPAPPPAYMPPAGGVNGFIPPTHVFPDAPPENSVYTTDMPPPYPGIYPGQPSAAYVGPAPPAPGFTPQGGAAPPPYNMNQPSAPADHQQAPPCESKAYPPIFDSYESPYDPRTVYVPAANGQQPQFMPGQQVMYMNGQQPPYMNGQAAAYMSGPQPPYMNAPSYMAGPQPPYMAGPYMQQNPYMNGGAQGPPPPYTTDGNKKEQ